MPRLTCTAIVVCSIVASVASAQTRNAQTEQLVERPLGSMAPDAVSAFEDATRALDRNDYAEAARLYQQVLVRAPRFSPALLRCPTIGAAL